MRFLFIALFLTIPIIVSAQGIVPQCAGWECQACHVVQLGSNIMDFLITASAFIAAIMVAVAGFSMVTSGGNAGQVSKAKGTITNVLIGFIILLAAWLIIDTVMKVFVQEDVLLGPWNDIQCVTQPVFDNRGATINTGYSVGGGSLYSGSGVAPGDGTCSPVTSGACTTSSLASVWGAQAANASQICNAESGGNPGSLSGSDIMNGDKSKPFSVGLFQINLTYHQLRGCGPGGTTLDCPSAFNGRNYTATIKNEALYRQCVEAAQNASCNMQNARRIFDESRGGSWKPWSTAKLCGLDVGNY